MSAEAFGPGWEKEHGTDIADWLEGIEQGVAVREALFDTIFGCSSEQCDAQRTIAHIKEAIEAWSQTAI